MDIQHRENKIIQTAVSKNSFFTSLIWKFLERGGTQGVQFIIQIVLARLLSPDDFGILAILSAFIALAGVLVSSGFNQSLIQKKDADQEDFSSVFWFSLFIAGIFYLFLFFMAPLISVFYKNELLTPVLRVLAITLFFGALNGVQSAMVSKTMQFKRFFFSSIGAAFGSGIFGILFACLGFGVWAIVIQQLTCSFLISLILWFTVRWRPSFLFSLRKLQSLFSYGWKLLCSALLDSGYKQLYSLTIGKVFSSSDLAFFNRGELIPSVIANNIDGSIQSVLLPALSSKNDDKAAVKQIIRRSISTSAFILMPCMFGLAAIAKPLVILLLTDKWLPCVPYLQLSCMAYAIYPLHTVNLTAISAMGRSDIFLKLEIIKKIIGITVMSVSIPFGILFMAITRVFSGILCTFVNAHPNKKLLNYKYFEQWRDIFPSFIFAIVMAIPTYMISFLEISCFPMIVIQMLVGAIIYTGLALVFKLEVAKYVISTIREVFRNRFQKTEK